MLKILLLTFSSLIIGSISLQAQTDEISDNSALIAGSMFSNNCDNFKQANKNTEILLRCAASNLHLESIALGNKEFGHRSQNQQNSAFNNKSAIQVQLKNLQDAKQVAQMRSLLQGAVATTNHVAALLALDKQTSFIGHLKKYKSFGYTPDTKTKKYVHFNLFYVAHADVFNSYDFDKLTNDQKPKWDQYHSLCDADAQIDLKKFNNKNDISASDKQKIKKIHEDTKICHEAVKAFESTDKICQMIITPMAASYVYFDDKVADKFDDKAHEDDSYFGSKYLYSKFKSSFKSKENRSSKKQFEEFIKTFENLNYLEEMSNQLLRGNSVNALQLPQPDSHGAKEALKIIQNSPLHSKQTKGFSFDLNNGRTPKQLKAKFDNFSEVIMQPLIRRIKNTLVYLESELADNNESADQEFHRLYDRLDFHYDKSSDYPDNSFLYIIDGIQSLFFSTAYASKSNTVLEFIKNLYSNSLTSNDMFISTPSRRYVQMMAANEQALKVKSNTDASISKMNINEQKLLKYLKIGTDNNDQNYLNNFINVIIPTSHAAIKKNLNLSMGCITNNCYPLSKIINSSNDDDDHPIPSQLIPYIQNIIQLGDEINKHKSLTNKAKVILNDLDKSKKKLNNISNQIENNFYKQAAKTKLNVPNLKQTVIAYNLAYKNSVAMYLQQKGIKYASLETSLFGKISRAHKHLKIKQSNENKQPIATSKPAPIHKKAITIPQDESYPTNELEIIGDPNSDIDTNKESNLFLNISKKYYKVINELR